MSFQYKKILVIGATSGIGEALASRFVKQGSSVIVVGRRKDKLEQFVHEHGKENASAVPFDITELQKIPNFVTNITKTHPDLDCVFLNSGMQRGFDFSKPETVDLAVVQEEFNTNYLSFLALTNAFLPYLKSKQEETALIYTTSGLALVPIIRCANYCASKAALHHYILCLREQLRGTSVKVVELFPPAVQSKALFVVLAEIHVMYGVLKVAAIAELHDQKHQPDIKDGRSIGMPLDEFIEEAYNGLAAGNEEVAVQHAKQWYDAFEPKRQELFHKLVDMMKKSYGGK